MERPGGSEPTPDLVRSDRRLQRGQGLAASRQLRSVVAAALDRGTDGGRLWSVSIGIRRWPSLLAFAIYLASDMR
jgi:hypothetical protein